MMRNTAMILSALLAVVTTAWTTPALVRPMSTMLFMASIPGKMENGDNPCWQDLYDDGDCSMESVYSASFVAAEWIKSMPCGAGIEDCDMPDPLQVPGAMEDGVAQVDVMDFLGLKRASLGSKDEVTP